MFGYDVDFKVYKSRHVKCRTKHRCNNCYHEIKVGEEAVIKYGFQFKKPTTEYICIPCYDC